MLNEFKNAFWLWASRQDDDIEIDKRVLFRRTFELDHLPQDCEIKISADSYYLLWINGKFVHRGPARGYQRNWSFDRIKVDSFLQIGRNVFAILGYQYGISTFSYVHDCGAGFIFSGLGINSDASWKILKNNGYMANVCRSSIQYCFQEFFDAGLYDGDWRQVNYDDSAWPNVTASNMRPSGGMPWHSFEERLIPLLTNNKINDYKVIAKSASEPDVNWRENTNLLKLYHRDNITYQTVASIDNTVRFDTESTSFIIDFGRECVGLLEFEFSDGGDTFDYMTLECVDGSIPRLPANDIPYHATSFGGRIILHGKAIRHCVTMPLGFRYLLIFNRAKSKFNVKINLIETIYPLQETGTFQSSNPALNRIWEMCRHTQRCCMVDTYIDCPWREFAQWWGDALVQAQNTLCLAFDTRLLERGIKLIDEQRTPDGLTYGVAPSGAHGCILPDYSAIWINTIELLFNQNQSIEIYDRFKGGIQAIIDYYRSMRDSDGLVAYDKRYWLFIDWSDTLQKYGSYNLFVLGGLKSAIKLAEAAGDNMNLAYYQNLEQELLFAIRNKLFNRRNHLLCDTPQLLTSSPHILALGIIWDVFPEYNQLWAEELLRLISNGTDNKLQFSSYFAYYIFMALEKTNYREQIIDTIIRDWGKYVDADCSTTPELWLQNSKFLSQCHAWSAHPLISFTHILLGVKPTGNGWKEITFQPLIRKGEKLSGSVPTPYGLIEVNLNWSCEPPIKQIKLPQGIKVV